MLKQAKAFCVLQLHSTHLLRMLKAEVHDSHRYSTAYLTIHNFEMRQWRKEFWYRV